MDHMRISGTEPSSVILIIALRDIEFQIVNTGSFWQGLLACMHVLINYLIIIINKYRILNEFSFHTMYYETSCVFYIPEPLAIKKSMF